jgi:hypothetical protein
VLERLVAIIQFLGQQCLASRGSSDILHEENNGNYLKLVELFAKFHSVMAEHLRRIRDKDTHVHYLGKRYPESADTNYLRSSMRKNSTKPKKC